MTDDGTVVTLSGRLDVRVAADVRNALAAAVDRGVGELRVDLAALEAVDATGLGVLMGAHRRAQRAGRTLVLEDVPAPVGRLLLVTRLDKVLQTRRTERCA
ncbi:MAG: anti-anti-sigma factor [Frankiales bacterium]|jgi:anti-anti-sigma factor|nr:anti-anti-sigma factor [Frankiales bacterium]